MNIDVMLFVLPAELDIDAARAMLVSTGLNRLRMLDEIDALTYAISEGASDSGEGVPEEDLLAEHAHGWIASFALLTSGGDSFFEQRFAHRSPLSGGRELLMVGIDLDGAHDPWYEDVFSLASAHYAPLARAMGVLVPGDFDLDIRVR